MILTRSHIQVDLLVSAAPCWDFSQEGKFKLILLNRHITRLAIWAVFFAVLFLSPHSPAEAATITTKHFLIDYAEISKPEALSFGKTADRAYEMVTEFLGTPQEHEFLRVKRIHMFIRSQFRIPRTLIFLWRGENRMEMPVHRVRDGKANLIHEISHSLAPSRNRFLAEGLAVYLEERFGNLSAFPTFGRPVQDLLCQYRMEGHFISLEALLRGNPGRSRDLHQAKRQNHSASHGLSGGRRTREVTHGRRPVRRLPRVTEEQVLPRLPRESGLQRDLR